MLQPNLDYITPPELHQETSCYVYETINNTNNLSSVDIKLTSLRSENTQEDSSTNCNQLNTKTSEIITNNNANNNKAEQTATQTIKDNYNNVDQNSITITTQPMRNNHNENSNQHADIITSQPKKTAPNNIENYTLLGILKNHAFMPWINNKISLVGMSENNVAFDQKMLYCHPMLSYNNGGSWGVISKNSCKSLLPNKSRLLCAHVPTRLFKSLLPCCKYSSKNSSLLPVNQLTLINTEDYDEYKNYNAEPLFVKKNNLPVKEISFNESNNEFIILYNDEISYENKSKLYLVKQAESLDATTEFNKINFDAEIKIECPVQKIHSIHYTDNNLYVIAQKNDCLVLMFANTDTTKEKYFYNWNEITTLASEKFNGSAKFSSNGNFIFLLSDNKKLLVFSKQENWSQINTITDISSYPSDINYTSERMIFIDNENFFIKSLKSNTTYNLFINKVTAACFIPDTKDLLIFTSEPKIYLAKQTDDGNNYNITSKESSTYIIRQAYFHPQDHHKLIVVADVTPDTLGIILNLLSSLISPSAYISFIACFGTCLKFTFFPCPTLDKCWPCACNSSTACAQYKINSLIGAYVGVGFSALICVLSCIDCGLSANTSQTKLLLLKDNSE